MGKNAFPIEKKKHTTTTSGSKHMHVYCCVGVCVCGVTLSRTTSLMAGRPWGLLMQAEMKRHPRRNSRSYFFFSSGSRGFHCSGTGGEPMAGWGYF